MLKALTHIEVLVNISDEEMNTIMYSRKYLLFNITYICVKKNGNSNFDFAIGKFDGAELYKLVGSYTLHILGEK